MASTRLVAGAGHGQSDRAGPHLGRVRPAGPIGCRWGPRRRAAGVCAGPSRPEATGPAGSDGLRRCTLPSGGAWMVGWSAVGGSAGCQSFDAATLLCCTAPGLLPSLNEGLLM